MHPVLMVIKERRSVRAYQSKPVPRELIEQVIDAGNFAPTGHNRQNWRFVVVEDKVFRLQLVKETRTWWQKIIGNWPNNTNPEFQEYIGGLGQRCLGWQSLSYVETIDRLLELEDGMYWAAPVVIFVIGTQPAECHMVCENMMLAAHALGLGSCIVGFGGMVTDNEEIVTELELKGNEKIFGPIVLGYADIFPDPPKKKSPVIKWI
jgi:nitroreductase